MIVARNYDMPMKNDMSELLDKCVLLNTYLSKYFIPCGYINGFDMYYRVDYLADRFSMYKKLANINDKNMNYGEVTVIHMGGTPQCRNTLFVNKLVLENTEAGEKIARQATSEYAEYNFVFTKLSENLKKEASGK